MTEHRCPYKGCNVVMDDIDEFVLHVATHKEVPVELPAKTVEEPKKRMMGFFKKKKQEVEVKTMPDKKIEEPMTEELEALSPEPQETVEMRLDYLEDEVDKIAVSLGKQRELLNEVTSLIKQGFNPEDGEALDDEPLIDSVDSYETEVTILADSNRLNDILHTLQGEFDIQVVVK